MENPFNLLDLDNTKHHHLMWHFDNPSEARPATWSIIAAHADSFAYNYDFLVHFITERNKTCNWGGDPFYYCPIPIPTKLEFLEILEFRADELRRATNDIKAEWHWPNTWGHVHWNCPVINRRAEVSGKYTLLEDGDLEKKVWFDLQSTIDATNVHKILMGHLSHLDLSSFDLQRNISLLLNIFYETKTFRGWDQGDVRYGFKVTSDIAIPPVLISYDMPPLLKKRNSREEQEPRWDIEELLGLYEPTATQYKSSYSPSFSPPKQAPQILVYERGLKYCANETGFPEDILRQIVVIHELSHWATHRLQDSNGNTWANELFDLTHTDIHEGWAQLLTFSALDYLNNKEYLAVFKNLTSNQSDAYRKYKEILSRCSDRKKILETLPLVREIKGGASFQDWLNLL